MAAEALGQLSGPQATRRLSTRDVNGISEQEHIASAIRHSRPSGHNSNTALTGVSTTSAPPPSNGDNLVDAVVHTDTDALHLLFSTALQQQHDAEDEANGVTTQPGQSSCLSLEGHGPHSGVHGNDFASTADREAEHASKTQRTPGSIKRSALSPTSSEVATVWSRFVPCQQRCVTSAEAIAYLD